MTEPRPEIDDELVSAVLDGEASAEERALVEGSPDGRRRLEELRAVAALVAEPVVPLAPATVDRLVAGALDADTPRSDAPAPVSSLDEGRRTRSRSWGQIVAAAAAAVLLVVGAAAGLRAVSSGSSSDSSSTATADGALADQSGTTLAASPESANSSGAASGAEDSGGLPLQLGPQPDAEAAADALAVRLDAADPLLEQTFEARQNAAAGACPSPPEVTPRGGPWTVVAVTTLPSGTATVLAEGSETASARLVVVDDATCQVLLDRSR